MEFQEIINRRYSVRAYKPDAVPDAALHQVLEAARLAPTAGNRQPFRIIVIHTSGREAELRRVYHREWFTQAPLVLCVCAVTSEAWTRVKSDGKSYVDVDSAIVMDHMVLAATDLGLGTCWVAAFDPQAAREVLDLPAGIEPMLFTPLGYPIGDQTTRERKSLAELVRYETW